MSKKAAIAVLRDVRALLAEPEGWTQERFARDSTGSRVPTHDPEAVCWDLTGAISKCLRNHPGEEEVVLDEVLEAMLSFIDPSLSMVGWNDAEGREHGEVLNLIDKGIERLEAEGARA